MIRVRNVLWSSAVAGCVVVVGFASACAKSSATDFGQGVCATGGNCANDETPSASAMQACNTQVNGPCGAEYSDLFNCEKSNATCSSSTGMSVAPPASTCAAESSALMICQSSDGGTTTSDSSTTGHDTGTVTTFDSSTNQDTGTTTGGNLCTDIITCANGCTDPSTAQTCVTGCYDMGSPTAQMDFEAIDVCLFGSDGMSGACGAMCGTQTTACSNCLMAAQTAGGACESQIQACASDTSKVAPPLHTNVHALPTAN